MLCCGLMTMMTRKRMRPAAGTLEMGDGRAEKGEDYSCAGTRTENDRQERTAPQDQPLPVPSCWMGSRKLERTAPQEGELQLLTSQT